MKAETLARTLGGRKIGNGGWIVRCPGHDDSEPSLSVKDAQNGKVLVYCHAGCSQYRVISALKARGLWPEKGPGFRLRLFSRNEPKRQSLQVNPKRSEDALAIWHSGKPAKGSLVETYLASRQLILPPLPNLRFHSRLKHPSGGFWPAMVALVTRGSDNVAVGIHRTFLARDGAGKAPVDRKKLMLGPCRGGAVRLADPTNVLMVGEGIETCLAAMQASGHPAWAALSTSGLKTLDLPKDLLEVIVLADADDSGSGEEAAQDCARRWRREGRRVRIARPPKGMDFNDMLFGTSPQIEESGR